jgi:hypothetical protein
MKRKNLEKINYRDDDQSRYSGPEYLDRISLNKARGTILNQARGKGPRGYDRPDARIYEDVCEALLNDPLIDARNIGVEVHQGIVTLRGAVEDRKIKKEVEECIEHIIGIQDVFNLITLYQFREKGGEGLIKNQARVDH